jgi:hypothetical protein
MSYRLKFIKKWLREWLKTQRNSNFCVIVVYNGTVKISEIDDMEIVFFPPYMVNRVVS